MVEKYNQNWYNITSCSEKPWGPYVIQIPRYIGGNGLKLYDQQSFHQYAQAEDLSPLMSFEDRIEQIESKLRPFCLVNKRFFPELWLCHFMRKQVLRKDGNPSVKGCLCKKDTWNR